MKLSLVVTVYSETFSIRETIARVLKHNRDYILEIILVVAPKASPETFSICYDLAKHNPLVRVYTQQQTPGVGWAIREGMALAQGDYVGFLSADLETEPEAIDRMVRKIEETGCDEVIGNRWLPGGGFKNYNRAKLVLNYIFQKVFKILFWTRLGDLTYGYKILSKRVCDNIVWEGVFHEIYIETTIKPLWKGYSIEQIPTVWVGRVEGFSSNSFLKNFRYVRMAFQVLFSSSSSRT